MREQWKEKCPTFNITKSILVHKDTSNFSTQSIQSTAKEDGGHALFFTDLRRSSKWVCLHPRRNLSEKTP